MALPPANGAARRGDIRKLAHMMPEPNLTPDEAAALIRLLRDIIAEDRFPLSPRVRTLKSVLAKLDPTPCRTVAPYPPPKAWVNSTIRQRKGRARH